MNRKIISFVKYNRLFLRIYRCFGNILLGVLKCVVPIKPKQILFISFGGRKYDDSPKVLYEYMRQDPFFQSCQMIWAFGMPEKYPEVKCEKVRVDSLKYYVKALSSGIWVTNSSVERGLNMKRKGIIEINTWHGTPLKKMGDDIHEHNGYRGMEKQTGDISIYCAQSAYDRDIFGRLFNTKMQNILLSDLPRNDELVRKQDDRARSVRKKLKIPAGKKIILYAPTFREYDRDGANACYIKPPVNAFYWREMLGEEYVVLFRAHYEVARVMGMEHSDFWINVSDYPSLNDLIIASDILISDYSSIYFDYAITGKPMFNFSYDFDVYCQKRGLYLDIEEDMGMQIHRDESALLNEIIYADYLEYSERTKRFSEKYTPYAGNACKTICDRLLHEMEIHNRVCEENK